MIWRTLLVIVAFHLLAAHFLREGQMLLMVITLLAPLLLLIKKRWARLILQGLLYAGAVLWLYTAYTIVQERLAAQGPWARMLVILAAVAAITVAAAVALSSKTVKQRYL